jgi:hypothetical protein
MEINTKTELLKPPKLIESLTSGFNAVTANIYLILFPILLDTFLWLGPHLRVKHLLEPFVINLSSSVADLTTPELGNMSKWSQEIWDIILTQFNLVSFLRTIPIGIPSLMAGLSPIKTPYGLAALFEVNGVFQTILLWGSFSIIGIVFGCIYFDAIARSTSRETSRFSLSSASNAFVQVLIFTLVFMFILLMFSIPVLLIISILTLISPALGEIALLFIGIVAIWFIMPLVFSPHGVFAEGKNIYSSISTSVRLVRNYLPGTGMFFLTALLLYQGLNVLWETAPETSWMSFVGIFGHAFISTGLIAASFVYYRNGITWMESKMQQTATETKPLQ